VALLTEVPVGYELADVAALKSRAQALLTEEAVDTDAVADNIVDLVLDAVRADVDDLLRKQRDVAATLIRERHIAHTSTLGYADGWNDALTLAESIITGRDMPQAA